MDDKKKKYVIPEAEIVDFADEDIITFTNSGVFPDEWIGEDWSDA